MPSTDTILRVAVVLALLSVPVVPRPAGAVELDRPQRSVPESVSGGTLETVVVLEQPLSIDEAAALFAPVNARVIAFEHNGKSRGGARFPQPTQALRALVRYSTALSDAGLDGVKIFSIRFSGVLELDSLPGVSSLALVPSGRAVTVTPASLGASVTMIPIVPQYGLDVDQAEGDVPLWVPSMGTLSGSQGDATHPRHITQTLSWPTQESLTAFGGNAYEHDIKLLNPNNSSGRWPYGCTFEENQAFWARQALLGDEPDLWTTNFPAASEPYFDTRLQDECSEMDLTVGVYRPEYLQASSTYRTDVWVQAGTELASGFALTAQSLGRFEYCPVVQQFCGNVPGNNHRLETEPLIHETEGCFLPGTHSWNAGQTTWCPPPPQPGTIFSPGPLTPIEVGEDLDCEVSHTGITLEGESREVLDPCATMLYIAPQGGENSKMFGPWATPSRAKSGNWTTVSQSPATGTGTVNDPYTLVTMVAAGTTGVTLTQTDQYITGQNSYRTQVSISNDSSSTQSGILYRVGLCNLLDHDDTWHGGFGDEDVTSGSVSCVGAIPDGAGGHSPTGRRATWSPVTPGSTYFEGDDRDMWDIIGNRGLFPSTCACSEYVDVSAGLSWPFTLAPGASDSYTHTTALIPG